MSDDTKRIHDDAEKAAKAANHSLGTLKETMPAGWNALIIFAGDCGCVGMLSHIESDAAIATILKDVLDGQMKRLDPNAALDELIDGLRQMGMDVAVVTAPGDEEDQAS